MSIQHSQFRFCVTIEVPAGRADPKLRVFEEEMRAALQAGATALILKPPLWMDQSASNLVRQVVENCRSENILSIIADDVLLGLKTGAHGILFTNCPISYARVRETIGPQRLIGRRIRNLEELDLLRGQNALEHLDFASIGSPFSEEGPQRGSFLRSTLSAREIHELRKGVSGKPVILAESARQNQGVPSSSASAQGIELCATELRRLQPDWINQEPSSRHAESTRISVQ